MRRSHPLLTVAAVLLALALVAAACGGDDGDSNGDGGSGESGVEADLADFPECPVDALEDAAGPVEITVWHSYTAKIEESLQDLAARYNDSQDAVTVRVEAQGVSYEELQRQFNQGIPSGQIPAIAILEDTQNQAMADSGVIIPGSACLEASGEDPDFLDAALDYYSIDGVLWPSGFNLSTPIMYFNQAHFRDAGLDPNDPPGTLDEIREASEAIAEAGVAETPFVLLLQPWFVENWLNGIGETVVNEANGRDGLATEGTLDTDAVVDLLTWIQEMEADGLLVAFPATDGQVNHYLAVAQQAGSMAIETSTAATSIEAFLRGELDPSQLTDDERVVISDDLDLELDIGAGQFPGIDAPGQVHVSGGAYYLTTAGTPEEQAAAWDFMTFLATVPSQVQNNLVGSYLPNLQSAADDPTLLETWDNTLSGQWLALSYDQLLNIDAAAPGPSIGPFTDVRAIMRDGLESLVLNGESPEAVADRMQAEVTAALEAYEDQNF